MTKKKTRWVTQDSLKVFVMTPHGTTTIIPKKVHQLFWFSSLRRGVKWRVLAKGEVGTNFRLHEDIGLA